MQVAMREARLEGGNRVGAIAGSAYGTVDASAEFVRRIYSKGAKLASPLVFPNLVPSSLVGHAAIYLGLRGPVFSVAELGLSGEAAFLAACELVESGEVSAMVAASVEERSVLAEGSSGQCARTPANGRVLASKGRLRSSSKTSLMRETRRASARPGTLFLRGEGPLRCRKPCAPARRRRFGDRAATRRRDESGARRDLLGARQVHRTRASNRQSRGARRVGPGVRGGAGGFG